MGRHDSSSDDEDRVRRRKDGRRSRREIEDVGRRVRVSDDEDHKSSRRDLEIGGVADGERRLGDKVREEPSSDEELARRSRKDRREVDSGSEDDQERDRGKNMEVDRVRKGINKDRVRADTCSDDDGFERRKRKRSLKVMEKQGRERSSHRGSRVIVDKPSDEVDDRQWSRKRRDHQRDNARKEEKSEVAKPKLPELNPSDNNAMALGKTCGVYIPPFKLASMMKEVEDKSSVETT